MARPLRTIPVLGKLIQAFEERLTARGRYLFLSMVILAVLGLDTRRNQVFMLFAVAAALFLVAAVVGLAPRPPVHLECRMPLRATALQPIPVRVRVAADSPRVRRGLQLSFPRPRRWGSSIVFRPQEVFLSARPHQPAEVTVELQAKRRGRYLLRGPCVRSSDPLQLVLTREVALPDQILLVYPRFYSLEQFMVPVGRRYQPGGIPLASSTGDAIEFVGTREYREGDPVKNIHWRSWARRGEPVVKEYHEEYFARIALILDTFLPPRPGPQDEAAFEAAVSVVASIADFFSRSEYIVDILAAGPDIYEVSTGRSLAYLETILDVLACLEPCSQPPFTTIAPHLFEKLAQITSVVAVLLDWDASREEFLRRVKALGTAVRIFVVREGATGKPWQAVEAELGEVSVMTPADVERSLTTRGSSGRGSGGRG
jgi:uncharacterized protein (DUF58 family)